MLIFAAAHTYTAGKSALCRQTYGLYDLICIIRI